MTLELQEAKEAMATKPHRKRVGLASTAVVIRLAEAAGIANSGRIMCGDAYFSNLRTAVNLKRMGIDYVGLVKNHRRGIPLYECSNVLVPEGKSLFYETTLNGIHLLFVSWMSRLRRSFISTINCVSESNRGIVDPSDGSTARGGNVQETPSDTHSTGILRPNLADIYNKNRSSVDHHNQMRHYISSETNRTICPSKRLLLSLVDICVVNGYEAYRLEKRGSFNEEPGIKGFLEKAILAYLKSPSREQGTSTKASAKVALQIPRYRPKSNFLGFRTGNTESGGSSSDHLRAASLCHIVKTITLRGALQGIRFCTFYGVNMDISKINTNNALSGRRSAIWQALSASS